MRHGLGRLRRRRPARHGPERLARALPHAARVGLSRTAGSERDDADHRALDAARASCLLQIALRAGAYDPRASGEREVWAALLGALPSGWAAALEDAAPGRAGAAGRPGPWPR